MSNSFRGYAGVDNASGASAEKYVSRTSKARCYVMFFFSISMFSPIKVFSLTIRFRFGYFRFRFIFVFSCIFVSIIVIVNDYDVFSLKIVFVIVNEINTVHLMSPL